MSLVAENLQTSMFMTGVCAQIKKSRVSFSLLFSSTNVLIISNTLDLLQCLALLLLHGICSILLFYFSLPNGRCFGLGSQYRRF